MDDTISRQAAIDTTTETVFVEYEENADKEESIIRQTKAAIRGRIKALPPVQPEIIRCKDCKYFELDHFEKVDVLPIPIIVAHEICMKWGEGCKSSIDGWCFMAERRTDERTDSETGCD